MVSSLVNPLRELYYSVFADVEVAVSMLTCAELCATTVIERTKVISE